MADADDGAIPFPIQTENAANLASKPGDIVPDTAPTELTEVGKILANLSRMYAAQFRQVPTGYGLFTRLYL
jgi:hypothetical protein